jgi:TRAP-type C4-dicarboxylate transport system permease small subunit
MNMQTHKVEKKFKYLTYGAFAFFLTVFILTVYILMFPDSEKNSVQIIATIMISSTFGLMTYFSLKTILSFKKYDISLDGDGIWRSYQSKCIGLIKWSEINIFREYQYLQKIQLLNLKNEKLIDIHYQLSNFSNLRDKLVENIEPNFNHAEPFTLYAPLTFHLFWLGGSIAWPYLFYQTFALEMNVLYAIPPLFCTLVFIFVYTRSIIKITFDESKAKSFTFFKKEYYPYDKIQEVKIQEDSEDGSRFMMLLVVMNNGDGFKLPKLNSNVLESYFKLTALINKNKPYTNTEEKH